MYKINYFSLSKGGRICAVLLPQSEPLCNFSSLLLFCLECSVSRSAVEFFLQNHDLCDPSL